jgi:hypothetical protein
MTAGAALPGGRSGGAGGSNPSRRRTPRALRRGVLVAKEEVGHAIRLLQRRRPIITVRRRAAAVAIRLGILAEVVASLLVGVALLLGLARRTCRASAARRASRWSGGSRGSGGASLLAGWPSAGGSSWASTSASRLNADAQPRAPRFARDLTCAAERRRARDPQRRRNDARAPDPGAIVAGDVDPPRMSVVTSFKRGRRSRSPRSCSRRSSPSASPPGRSPRDLPDRAHDVLSASRLLRPDRPPPLVQRRDHCDVPCRLPTGCCSG